jgi:uncharacterized iron-regulated membrane protein
MITWCLLGLVAAGLGWVAWETRRVHHAIDRYATEMRQWHRLLRLVEARQQEEDR